MDDSEQEGQSSDSTHSEKRKTHEHPFLFKTLYFPSNSKTQVLFRLEGAKIAFMDGTQTDMARSCWKRTFNCMVRTKTAGYTHSELIFVMENQEDFRKYWISCGIRAGEEMKFEFREYSSFLWKPYALIITPYELNYLFQDCLDDVLAKTKYNNAVYWNFIAPQCFAIDHHGRKVWCSEHNVHKFRNLGWEEFNQVDAYLTDPYTLLQILIDNNRLAAGTFAPSQFGKEFHLTLPDVW